MRRFVLWREFFEVLIDPADFVFELLFVGLEMFDLLVSSEIAAVRRGPAALRIGLATGAHGFCPH